MVASKELRCSMFCVSQFGLSVDVLSDVLMLLLFTLLFCGAGVYINSLDG